jgi:hypothetical protein
VKKYEFWQELECAGCEVVRRAPAQCCAEGDKVHGSFSYSCYLIKFQSIVARQIHRSKESGARLYQEVCGSRGTLEVCSSTLRSCSLVVGSGFQEF